MYKTVLLLATAPLALLTSSAFAEDAPRVTDGSSQTSTQQGNREVFSTGVAKGRDRLDAAISTSSLDGYEVEKLRVSSIAEIVRNIPGIRVEAAGGVANNSFTVRGLPLASSGSKYLQFQEDGLPILEFGDLFVVGPDLFFRNDLSLSAVEAIRGGSASTFASNSPGGVINFISETGLVEGGAIEATTGLDHDSYRIDFRQGARINDTLRFHIGGFYREGDGPRDTGYTAYRGGQVKANITKELAGGGYVRLYGKYLDDRVPAYTQYPVGVTGTNDDPHFKPLSNFDLRNDTLLSPYINNVLTLDENNNRVKYNLRDGIHSVVKSFGVESQFDISDWTITERFRYANMSGGVAENFPLITSAASIVADSLGGPGAQLQYASGPNAGQVIADPAALNGNGLLAASLLVNIRMNSINNVTNDIRASRIWDLGRGKLTLTAGFYKSRQSFDTDWTHNSIVSDVRGDGKAALVDIISANGVAQTQDGYFGYSDIFIGGAGRHQKYNVDFHTNAPYGSLNYHIGKVAIGGSIRYNAGHTEGTLYGAGLGDGRVGMTSYDMNGDGVISEAESRTSIMPITSPAAVDYKYNFFSYSGGVNYRIAEPLAVFGRYSLGGRAAADRVLFTPAVDNITGKLLQPADAYDMVKQAEVGVKYRQDSLSLNLTGFWAKTNERNVQITTNASGVAQLSRIYRTYRAYGLEFEGSYQRGPFRLTAGATYTNASIVGDDFNPAVVGNTPRHQPDLIFQVTPQYETERFAVGANIIGTTSSYAQDSNQLKLPAYTLVNGFVQFRLNEQVQLALTANNLFDKLALTDVNQTSIPASGVVSAQALNGRTVSASVRFSF